MCYFLPMLHSFPIHASMLTFLMIAVDRYRLIVHPMKPRVRQMSCFVFILCRGTDDPKLGPIYTAHGHIKEVRPMPTWLTQECTTNRARAANKHLTFSYVLRVLTVKLEPTKFLILILTKSLYM